MYFVRNGAWADKHMCVYHFVLAAGDKNYDEGQRNGVLYALITLPPYTHTYTHSQVHLVQL